MPDMKAPIYRVCSADCVQLCVETEMMDSTIELSRGLKQSFEGSSQRSGKTEQSIDGLPKSRQDCPTDTKSTSRTTGSP